MVMRMESSLKLQSKHGTMDDEVEDELGSLSSSSSSSSFSDEECSSSTLTCSSSSEFLEDGAASSSFLEMSSLIAQLPPMKRGLSKHFQGKSQSFTSLANVRSLEDLVKPERPLKKLKSCKSFADGLDSKRAPSTKKPLKTLTAKKFPVTN
ncbi:uncharacterized protein LOC120275681 [Dioscorea cayenensis subsp. rotundata]|uniref:Uncharacterized protein LOC120275681 n=1 Tax=Dioscorea cayennensis subsp. rotundata TaxID=55577 RepID=A0AB40CEN7_DIOCR|nr:uncharacterized protein LOC120275681 [Dioscorea cayenensis subsp. rotundata]